MNKNSEQAWKVTNHLTKTNLFQGKMHILTVNTKKSRGGNSLIARDNTQQWKEARTQQEFWDFPILSSIVTESTEILHFNSANFTLKN